MTKKVAVGSKNPIKIETVKIAFSQIWPEEKWEVIGVEVSSGVSNQPMSDKESIKGARTRATKAIEKAKADFGVGLEGGLQQIGDAWYECGWSVVMDKEGKEGVGSSARLKLPRKFMTLIHTGKELGEATDIIFNRKNTKHAEGFFGLMTKNHITRTTGYKDGVVMALSRFLTPEVFGD